MKWFKYRHKFSSGPDPEWNYKLYTYGPQAAYEFIQDYGLTDTYSYSEHYRGIEYEIVDKPDPDWVLLEIRSTEDGITELRAYVKLLEGLLE